MVSNIKVIQKYGSGLGTSRFFPCVLQHKEPPLDALHYDGAALEVRVAGPGPAEAGTVALWGHVEVAQLLQLRVFVLDVGDVQDSQTGAVVGFVGDFSPRRERERVGRGGEWEGGVGKEWEGAGL